MFAVRSAGLNEEIRTLYVAFYTTHAYIDVQARCRHDTKYRRFSVHIRIAANQIIEERNCKSVARVACTVVDGTDTADPCQYTRTGIMVCMHP